MTLRQGGQVLLVEQLGAAAADARWGDPLTRPLFIVGYCPQAALKW
jgi:hypothetical protein